LVGGGVLGRGCVQEEIRFLCCTELIVSRLFTEELEDLDCLVVTGCEQFNDYRGYSNSFQFGGDFRDKTQCDGNRRRLVQVIVMDAMRFLEPGVQFGESEVTRELNKAFCGFSSTDANRGSLLVPAIATGNWGCGDFHGDRQLKALIQLMAAAEAGRDVCYFTFDDQDLVRDLYEVHKLIRYFDLRVGDVWKIISQFTNVRSYADSSKDPQLSLFQYILNTYMQAFNSQPGGGH
jgi:poly(ADP-ribose) glycohydrolase